MPRRRWIIIGAIILGLCLLWIYRAPLIASLRWFGDVDAVVATIRGYGWWGPAVLFMLFILQTFIAFIPGQALSMAGGFVYGFTSGVLIAWSSGVFGGQIAFWLARRYGRPFAEKWVAAPTLDRWDKSAAGQGVGFYIITLLLPLFPNDAMCYVAGLSAISFNRFLIANITGRGIAAVLTVIVGAYGREIPALIWIFIAGFIVLGIIGWFAARHYTKSQTS